MSSYEFTLRNVLERKEPMQSFKLKEIEEIIKKILIYTQSKFPYFTPHGFTHSLEVEECLNWLIPDKIKEKLYPVEIFLLICAAWVHDWGMIGFEGENPEEIRKNHHIRTEEIINKDYEKIRISRQEAIILGKICRGHRKEDLNTNYYSSMSIGQGVTVNVRFLAALIRIADEFDITANRVPEMIYYKLNPSSKAAEEFRKHLKVIGIAYPPGKKYKVVLSGIARDPRAADTIKKIQEKLQTTLNSAKTILATNGMEIDSVELNLTTQGFIFEPIKFEINEKKIIELLIGDHLYDRKDVAIRELLQNSVDACKLRKIINPAFCGKIIIRKIKERIIEVEDNGIGMDFFTAKQFLSFIGESFRNSDEFKEIVESNKVNLIARFGIGILSCLLMADEVTVETKRKENPACKFTISSSMGTWKYEKGSLVESGTRITLLLKDDFDKFNLRETLKKYIIKPEIPVYVQENDDEIIKFDRKWNLKSIINDFSQDIFYQYPESFIEVLNFENEDFKLILGIGTISSRKNVFLFNQGFFVRNLEGILENCILCIDIKTDLFDLKISREDVEYNDRWREFRELLTERIVDEINQRYSSDREKYYDILKNLSGPLNVVFFAQNDIFEEDPLYKCFYSNVDYPIFKGNELVEQTLEETFGDRDLIFYEVKCKEPFLEINFAKKFLNPEKIYVFNLYNNSLTYHFNPDTKVLEHFGFYQYFSKKTDIKRIDLFDLLNQHSKPVNHNLSKIIPENFHLMKFPDGINPFIVLKGMSIIEVSEEISSFPDLHKYFLLNKLMEDSRLSDFDNFLDRYGINLTGSFKVIKPPEIVLSTNDGFIGQIVKLDQNRLDHIGSSLLRRYFSYLSILPFILVDFENNLFYLEVIDNIEQEIAEYLHLRVLDIFVKRMGNLSDLIFDCYDKSSFERNVTLISRLKKSKEEFSNLTTRIIKKE